MSIFIGGNHPNITQNLHAALLHLRDSTFPRILWIDAIRMDQAENEEKSSQIQIVAQIYALAGIVIVWLGDAADDSDKVLKMIQTAGQKIGRQVLGRNTRNSINIPLWTFWFQRTWANKTAFSTCSMSALTE